MINIFIFIFCLEESLCHNILSDEKKVDSLDSSRGGRLCLMDFSGSFWSFLLAIGDSGSFWVDVELEFCEVFLEMPRRNEQV
jgi:hypothetical protein